MACIVSTLLPTKTDTRQCLRFQVLKIYFIRCRFFFLLSFFFVHFTPSFASSSDYATPSVFFTILFLQTTQQALMHQKTELILTTAREKGKKKTHVDIELNRKKWRNRKTRILNKA